jgi:hypothetical protein
MDAHFLKQKGFKPLQDFETKQVGFDMSYRHNHYMITQFLFDIIG